MQDPDYIVNNKVGVHQTHCCAIHGCKYGDEDCPVVLEEIAQTYLCEDCEDYYLPWIKTQIEVSSEVYKSFEKGKKSYYIFESQIQNFVVGQVLYFIKKDEPLCRIRKIVADICQEELLPSNLLVLSFANYY